MSDETKEPTKHNNNKSEGVRRPQRKDSFSSMLSWAGLQTKVPIPLRATLTTANASGSTTSQTTPSNQNTSKPRRHSHSVGDNGTKKKARPGSISRKFSFSNLLGVQDGTGTKTKNVKTPPPTAAPEPKASDGTPKAGNGKNGSQEKVNKMASSTPEKKNPQEATPPNSLIRSKSPPPVSHVVPKSILRVSSPEGCRKPKFADIDSTEPLTPSTDAATPTPSSGLESPPGSPLLLPVNRPMSPGATVRFAKATYHTVEFGPGRRFLPVKRKSKSTITYISPLDPGTQKSAPKTILQSPTKLRRHQENQKAMKKYWLRTEEEEAEERAEAERRAQEEAERYRNEPSSPPPIPPMDGIFAEATSGKSMLAEKLTAIDELPPLGGFLRLEKLEEEDESSDSDPDDAGAKCNEELVMTEVVDLSEPPEEKEAVVIAVEEKQGGVKMAVIEEIKDEEQPQEDQKENTTTTSITELTTTTSQEEGGAPISPALIPLPPSPTLEQQPQPPLPPKPPLHHQPKSFFHNNLPQQKDKEAAAERARRAAELVHQSLLDDDNNNNNEITPTRPRPSPKHRYSSRSSSLSRTYSPSPSPSHSSSSSENSLSDKEQARKEKQETRTRTLAAVRSSGNLGQFNLKAPTPIGRADTEEHGKTSSSPPVSRSGSPSGGGNHLHLSERRTNGRGESGRRLRSFAERQRGITA